MPFSNIRVLLSLAALGIPSPVGLSAQAIGGVPAIPPPAQELVVPSAHIPEIRVVPLVSGLSHPWSMAFRSNGDILVTERDRGALRIIRDGVLLERDVEGVPETFTAAQRAGLMDIALHPDDDGIVYLTYSKLVESEDGVNVTIALARGRLEGEALTEVSDIFVAKGYDRGTGSSKLIFAPDGTLFMTVGGSFVFAGTGSYAQDPSTHFGKLLRLNDDGTPAADNPFVDDPAFLPEIFSLGHRNQLGLAFHPATGALWATENGPQGGDEANIIVRGGNYGWPTVSFSREYTGPRVSEMPWRAGFEEPEVLWWPSIAPSGMVFYSGDRFPEWRGNLFVGSLMVGRMNHTGHLQRIVFNEAGEEMGRESLLSDLRQRIRDVRQGPDGLLYLLTEEDDAVLLRIEPSPPP